VCFNYSSDCGIHIIPFLCSLCVYGNPALAPIPRGRKSKFRDFFVSSYSLHSPFKMLFLCPYKKYSQRTQPCLYHTLTCIRFLMPQIHGVIGIQSIESFAFQFHCVNILLCPLKGKFNVVCSTNTEYNSTVFRRNGMHAEQECTKWNKPHFKTDPPNRSRSLHF
jgi:hypothetical protein